MPKKIVRSPGGLNLVAFFETWGKIMGEIHGVEVELETITHKETGEVVYSAHEEEPVGKGA